MAKTFDPNRVLPGTIELVRDANGNYTTKVVGLESINSLSLPEISTSAIVTKTDTDTKTATEITGDTLQKQTQMAFKTDDDRGPDTTGSMLQDEAKKTSKMLSQSQVDSNRDFMMGMGGKVSGLNQSTFDAEKFDETEDKVSIKDPTEDVFGRSTLEDEQRERQTILPDLNVGKKTDRVTSADVQAGRAEAPGFDLSGAFDFLKGDKFKEGTPFARPKEGTIDQAAANNMTQEGTAFARPDRGTIDQMAADSLGISADPSGTLAAKEADFASGSFPGRTVADSDLEADAGTKARADIKPEARTTLKDSLATLTQFSPLRIAGKVIESIVKEPTPVQKHATQYFTNRGDGRIGGNPATDLYAGMNRVSAFGNLEKAGEKRIATRTNTINKRGVNDRAYAEANGLKYNSKGVSADFHRNTNNMKNQQNDYKKSLDKKTSTRREAGAMNQPGRGGDQSGRSGGKIVCTMMNESYGFGSFRNKIWMKFHGNIAPEYQKGYHKLFLPLVKYAKQKGIINKIIKKVLEHIAIHRTIDIRQEEKNKIHLIGRVYRKILEPICYWAGKV